MVKVADLSYLMHNLSTESFVTSVIDIFVVLLLSLCCSISNKCCTKT